LLIVSIALNTTISFGAGWVDDWLQQKTSSGPNYYQGQQRGYATAGSFNARWKTGVDYPISISPPSFKAGCGGIDFFQGSISMLNMDMLVAKLQRILQNAAGIAFNMALETVCPKCANIMNVMESISNQLNGMGMNDCSMAKGLTVGVADAGKSAIKDLEEGTLSESVSNSLSDGYDQAHLELLASGGTNTKAALDWLNTKMATPPDKDPLNSGCPADLTDMFPSDLVNGKSYVLDVIGTKLGLPTAHIDVMRGLVGDIIITGADNGYTVTVIPGCSENGVPPDVDAIKEGFIMAKPKGGTCALITDTNADLTTYTQNMMTSISGKMKAKTQITAGSDEENFIKNSPLPVAYALKVGIGSGQEDIIISNLSSITATALSIKAITELMKRINTLMQVGEELNKNFVLKDKCHLYAHIEKLKASQKTLNERIQSVQTGLYALMQEQMASYNNVVNLVGYLEGINKQLKEDLANKFGATVAQRAMR
jgi:conjugative transfer pilus assembly protein TraH